MKLLVVLLCGALAIQTNRVLIVSDSVGIYISHSLLFDRLKEQGYKLEFKNLSSFINLQSYGEWLFDHAIIFASSIKDLPTPEKSFLDFFDAGKNIILLGTPNQAKYFRKLQNQFGFDMHERGVTVQDFFNNLNTPDNSLTKNINIFQISKNVAYAGSGLSLSPYETNQVYGLVRGSETAFSGNIFGHNIIYVGGTQGRNNARFVTTGGYDVFSNEFLTNNSLGNLELLDTTIRWTFGQINVLRVQNIQHRRVNSTELNPQNYKVSEDIYFSLEIQQWDYKTQQYVPYISSADDVILEFTMLDPYYRVPLKKGKGSKYELEFRLPDKYGVFQFKVQYAKPGYTFLNVAEKVTVRPLRHDEHPRYLTQAFPYYLSSFATMGGFLVFVLTFLFNK